MINRFFLFLSICSRTYNAKKSWQDLLWNDNCYISNIASSDCGDIGVCNMSLWYMTGQRVWVGGWQIYRISVLNYFIILMVIQGKCPGLLLQMPTFLQLTFFPSVTTRSSPSTDQRIYNCPVPSASVRWIAVVLSTQIRMINKYSETKHEVLDVNINLACL